MQLTSSPRRALGLVAAGAIGLSTAVLGAAGPARADSEPVPVTFDAGDGLELTVPDGYCSIDWLLIGGQGGSNGDGVAGAFGGRLEVSTPVEAGQVFYLAPGPAASDSDEIGGKHPHTDPNDFFNGGDGVRWGGGGGGAASLVALFDAGPVLVAFGGDGKDDSTPGGQGGGGDVNLSVLVDLTDEQKTATDEDGVGGNGSITGTIQPCAATLAPSPQPTTPTVTPPAATFPAPVIPPSVPTAQGSLTITPDYPGAIVPGRKVTVAGEGYAPGSPVAVVIYSTPQVLTTIIADGNGAFSVQVTIPAGLAAGRHTLVASGVDLNGVVRYVSVPVTVAAGGGAVLAATGADVTAPVLAGVAALGLGGGLLAVARRRTAA